MRRPPYVVEAWHDSTLSVIEIRHFDRRSDYNGGITVGGENAPIRQ